MNDALTASNLFRLDHKVAVVTGAASGIGKATAMLFADAGASVVVADRNASEAHRVAKDLGAEHMDVNFDLDNASSIEAMVAAVAARYGSLDILVNNAGIYPRFAIADLTEADWTSIQRTNVWGCFVTMRAAADAMRRGGRGGRIINVSSIGAVRTAVNDQIAYNASKAALDSMTLSAALDFAKDGILVNSILPGAVQPLDPKPHPPGRQAATGPLLSSGRMLIGRAALPSEVAGPILMLAASAGGYMTGQTIIVDGGFSIS